MCGIGFISLTEDSKINPRELSHALLSQLEDRGYMAAGYAYGRPDATPRYYKDDVLGRYLDLSRIPQKARSVILHTRLATHGSTHDNRNNHPLLSPDRSIALVHNGVLWNHYDLRKEIPFELPEVDSSVAPALLQMHGVPGLKKIAGDAAFLWLDTSTGNVIHAARQEHSPLAVATLTDGSMVGASTYQILDAALDELGLQMVSFDFLEELQYIQILDGKIISDTELEQNVGFNQAYAASTRAATSGGGYQGVGSSFYDDWPVEWDDEPNSAYTEDLWGREIHDFGDTSANYYATDYYGNEMTFNTFQKLCITLSWHASQEVADEDRFWLEIDPEVTWIEFFCDIGELSDRGHEVSWLEFPDLLTGIEKRPDWLYDGIGYLRQLERASA